MTYFRVIPRDLFNEGDLLKCFGQLYLGLEKIRMEHLLVHTDEQGYFQVAQSQDDGSLWLKNVQLIVRGQIVTLSRPLNARSKYPLWLTSGDDVEIRVFDDAGNLSQDMLKFLGWAS